MPKKINTLYLVLISILLLTSCRENDHKQHKNTEKKYKLSFHLKPGDKYYYTITAATNMKLEVQEKVVENKNNATIGLIYEMLNDSAGNHLLRITYDSFHILTRKGEEEKEIDAANAASSTDPSEKILGIIKGSSVLMSINDKGKVVAVNGFNTMMDKIMASVNVSDIPSTQVQEIRKQLSAMLGDDFLKTNMEQNFGMLPDTGVYIGDSWKKDAIQQGDMHLNSTGNFTLEEVDNGVAKIKSSSDFDNAIQNNPVIMGFKAAADFKGKEEGTYAVDINSGILTNAKSNTSMQGNVQVMGRDVPVTIELKKEISVKKL